MGRGPYGLESLLSRQAGMLGRRPASGRGCERAELREEIPAPHGLDCTVYQYVADRTAHLRESVYITFGVDGGEFRPSASWALRDAEHSPVEELVDHQLAHGDTAYGEGRPLEVLFACYSPAGSGAADRAASEIRDALAHLRGMAGWGEQKRSMFGIRYGTKWVEKAKRAGYAGAYRPPEGVLPARGGPPR